MKQALFFLLFLSTFLSFGQNDRGLVISKTTTSNNKMLALVIGNNDYLHTQDLQQTKRDAKVIESALSKVGFDVVTGYNLDYQNFYEAIDDFGEQFEHYDLGLIFYAGHAAEVDGINYLMPTDANPISKRQMNRYCVPLSDVFQSIGTASKPKVIVLDACRNNPFIQNWTAAERNHSSGGLAKVESEMNSYIAFSTATGTTVKDDNPFSQALANAIEKGGCIEEIMRKVRNVVRRQNSKQAPWTNSSLLSEVCFGDQKALPLPSPTIDSDGDGLTNAIDDCPNEYGSFENKGCPEMKEEIVNLVNEFSGDRGTFIDERDGQEYKWVRMKDGRIWMAENLNYKMADSWCYDNEKSNCEEYGRIYNWFAVKKACPDGWKLPSDTQWWKLASNYGKAYNNWRGQQKNKGDDAGQLAYRALLEENSVGFSASLGGQRQSEDQYLWLGEIGYYWSSTESSSSDAWYYGFSQRHGQAFYRYFYADKYQGHSCRCIQR